MKRFPRACRAYKTSATTAAVSQCTPRPRSVDDNAVGDTIGITVAAIHKLNDDVSAVVTEGGMCAVIMPPVDRVVCIPDRIIGQGL
jgi:hypothetical protein